MPLLFWKVVVPTTTKRRNRWCVVSVVAIDVDVVVVVRVVV